MPGVVVERQKTECTEKVTGASVRRTSSEETNRIVSVVDSQKYSTEFLEIVLLTFPEIR